MSGVLHVCREQENLVDRVGLAKIHLHPLHDITVRDNLTVVAQGGTFRLPLGRRQFCELLLELAPPRIEPLDFGAADLFHDGDEFLSRGFEALSRRLPWTKGSG